MTISDVFPIVASLINATTTPTAATVLSTTVDDSRHSTAEIREAIRLADREIALAIISTPNHPMRARYLTPRTATYGQALPATEGGWFGVEVQDALGNWRPAIQAPREFIQRVREFPALFRNADDSLNYFDFRDYKAFFTGVACRFLTLEYVAPTGDDLLADDQYRKILVDLAVAILLAKEGGDLPGAAFYRQMATDGLTFIRQQARES